MNSKKLAIALILVASSVTAINVNDIEIKQEDLKDAARFGLSAEQWVRYKEHMAADGKYMEPMNPIESLAVSTHDEEERRTLARMQAERELMYVQNTLRFDEYFSEAVETIVRGNPKYNDKKFSLAKLGEHFTGVFDAEEKTYLDGDQIRLSLDIRKERESNLAFRKAHAVYRAWREQGIDIELHLFVLAEKEDEVRAWANKTTITPYDTMAGNITINMLRDSDTAFFDIQVYRDGAYLWTID